MQVALPLGFPALLLPPRRSLGEVPPPPLNRGALPGDDTEEKTLVVQAEDFNPLPITPDFYRCELGDFEAGSYNVSVQLPMGLAWSNPVDTGLYARDATGLKYQVQYYPIIKEMSPQLGSIAGGTEVTIRGHGFSMDEEDISIDIGGSKCVVESSTLEEIICVTQPVLPDRYILDSSLLPVTPFTW